VQGIVGNDETADEGFALGVMALGGSALSAAVAVEREIQVAPRDKGQRLAQALRSHLGEPPELVVLLYDPLCGADAEALLSGVRLELSCPIVGGAASQPWGVRIRTFQYFGDEVLSRGVVGMALSGSFGAEVGICHGTTPTGVSWTVTKAEGNHLLELDGRPAIEVWREVTGYSIDELVSDMAGWGIGVERRIDRAGSEAPAGDETVRVMRGVFGFDFDRGAIIVQAAIPAGTRVALHRRDVDEVLRGTEVMASELVARIHGRRPWAVLGFECGARTYPFLGLTNTLAEHASLRAAVAPDAPWLGMMAWGEIGPSGGEPAFHNFTYPLIVLTDR
jgi:small ligand-binding sensory domain FIST